MADRAVNQFKPCRNRLFTDFFNFVTVAYAFNFGIGTEIKVYFIGVIYSLLSKLLAYKRREIPSDLTAERKFAVRECPGTRKTSCDMAIRLAVHAFFCFCLRAVAVFDRLTLFYNNYALFAALFNHFKCSKNPGGTSADDYNIFFHFIIPILCSNCIYYYSIIQRKKQPQNIKRRHRKALGNAAPF